MNFKKELNQFTKKEIIIALQQELEANEKLLKEERDIDAKYLYKSKVNAIENVLYRLEHNKYFNSVIDNFNLFR